MAIVDDDDGLVDFIPRSARTPAHVVGALRTLAAGGTVDPRPSDLDQSIGAWPGQEQGLTAREAEILAFILQGFVLQGFSNEEITAAASLSITMLMSHIRTASRTRGSTCAPRRSCEAWLATSPSGVAGSAGS